MKTCKSCGCELIWATTPSGKPMPLEAAPDDQGTVMLMNPPGDEQVTMAITLSGTSLNRMRGLVPLYLSHHARCPEAARWRKK